MNGQAVTGVRAETEDRLQTAGVPSEVRDDLDDESREHGQWPANGRYPPDKVTTRELVEYEAAMVGKKPPSKPNSFVQAQPC